MNNGNSIRRILVDGKNLALRQGTGVATYARSLCLNLTATKRRVELLYGEKLPSAASSAANVSSTLNALRSDAAMVASHVTRRVTRFSRLFGAITPQRIDVDFLDRDGRFQSNAQLTDRIWNISDGFDTPALAVRAGKFQNVRNVMEADAAHWTYPLPVRLEGVPNIYTLHDLVPLILPQTTLDDKKFYYALIKRIVETADLIVTVSHQSKIDIHSMFNVPDSRVINTYQDVEIPPSMLFSSEESVENAVRQVSGLEVGRYILFYGAIEPKKNVGRLIEAYLSSDIGIPLVIAGKDGWMVEEELRLYTEHVDQPRGTQRIIRLPYVPRHQLVHLVRGARAVAFPSLYEGFGLPLAEAMLCGTPLITSNMGAMKEIAGDAALLVDPYDVGSIREGLKRITREPTLRKELSAAGLERVSAFSSSNYRQRLAGAYSCIV
ncbi:glycosyltransferase family 4 protein [Ensifer adhaerens]|uniref:glycosyltransferase family 4 protein n=1 Tax=Ensifer adhaerens TaxID=106592 RepID=UPI003D0812F2